MSQTIDNRIVEMQFENKQFESGVQESLSTLDKLKKALKFDDASKNLMDFSKATKQFNLNDIGTNVEKIGDKFSAFGAIGFTALQRLTNAAIDAGARIFSALNAPLQQIKSGGWARAMNIENAKFQLEGLQVAWDKISEDVNYGVKDTAYGLDAAAKAASQLVASGVKFGETYGETGNSPMAKALRGISGVAAMTNSSYEEISSIFTTVAGQGKLMTMQLRQLESRGLNAAASIGRVLGKSEAEIREMVTKGKIDFNTFSKAMDDAFGEHATEANKTFSGAMSNIRAALSKIGAEFATPLINNAIPVLNKIRLFINDLKATMTPVFEIFSNIMSIVSTKLIDKIDTLRDGLFKYKGIIPIWNSFRNILNAIVRVMSAVKIAFDMVFPKTKSFADNLNSATTTIEKFTSKLIMSDTVFINFTHVMEVVFLLIKNLGNVIKYLLTLVKPALTFVLKVITVIAKLIVYVAQLISNLEIFKRITADIKQSGGVFVYIIDKLRVAFSNLRSILTDTSTVTGQVVSKIKNAVSIIAYLIVSVLYTAFVKLREIISNFNFRDPLGSILSGVKNLINNLRQLSVVEKVMYGIRVSINAVSTAIGAVIGLFNKLKDTISSFFNSLFGGERVIEKTVEQPMAYAANEMDITVKHLEKGKQPVEEIASSFDKAKFSMLDFVSSIRGKLTEIKTGEVLLFAFGSAVVYFTLKAANLMSSLSSLTKKFKNFIGVLSKGVKNYGKKHSTFSEALKSIAIGIATLTASLYVLSNIPNLTEVTTQIAILLGIIGAASVLSSFGKGTNGFADAMKSLGIGIALLVAALIAIDKVKLENVKQDIIVLGVISASLLVISAILSKVAPSFTKGGLALLAFAGSIYILAQAISIISASNLEKIKTYYQELTVIILAFGAFAAFASKVGLGAALGLLTFIGIFKLLVSRLDESKSYVKTIQTIFEVVTNYLKDAVKYLYSGLKQVSEDIDKSKTLGILIAGGVASIVSIMLAIGNAGKGFKKFAVGVAILAATVAGLMFLMIKMSELMKAENAVNLDKIIDVLTKIGIFIGAVMGIAGLSGSRSKQKGDNKSSYEANNSLIKEVRKLLTSLGLLLVSIGAFSAMIGRLDEDEFNRAISVLQNTLVFLGIVTIVVASITAFASKNGKADVSVRTFIGVTLLMGTIVSAIAVLMFTFRNVSWKENSAQLVAVAGAIILMTILIGVILSSIAKIKSAKTQEKSVKSILAFSALVLAIAGAVALLVNNIGKDDLGRAGIILLALLGTIEVMGLLMKQIQISTSKNLKSKDSIKAFSATIMSIVGLIGIMAALGLAFAQMTDVNAGRMAAQAATLTGVIVALSILTMAIQRVSNEKKYNISDGGLKKIISTFSGLAILVAAFVVLANTLKELDKVDTAGMALKALTLGVLLAALSTIAILLNKFIDSGKFFKSSMGVIVIAELVGILEWLVFLFHQLEEFKDFEGIRNRVLLLGGVLVALIGLTKQLGKLAKNSKEFKAGGLGALYLVPIALALEAVYGICYQINNLKDPVGLLAKVAIVIGVLGALIGLTVALGALIKSTSLLEQGAIGALMLVPLGLVLEGLVLIFNQIEKLKDPVGLIAKSQEIMLVLVELIGLTVALGALMTTGLPILGAIAAVCLIPLVGVFDWLITIFDKINTINNSGVNIAQVNSIIGSLVLGLAGLVGVGIAATLALPGLLGLAGALAIIIASIGGASEKVTKLVDSINNLVRLSGEVTKFFNAIATGIKNASAAVAAGILAIATSISNAKSIIKGAAAGIGDSIKEGIKSKIEPSKWGLDFVQLMAKGMASGQSSALVPVLNSIASKIKAYLGHSGPTEGPLVGDSVYGFDFTKMLADGMTDGLPNITGSLTSIASTIKDGIGNIDLREVGQFIMGSLAQGLGDKLGDAQAILNRFLELLGLADAKAQALTKFEKAASRTSQEYAYQLRSNITGIEKKLKPLEKTISDIESKGYKAGSNLTGQLTKLKGELETNQKQLKDLENTTFKTSEATDTLTDSLGDFATGAGEAGKAAKETKDEIESFYEKIEGAISLFDEFNRESDLSAEQVLNNMKSQIEGITEWSNQIAKLAYKGIDKGLLQKLAEMGPQGYKYTSAFVNMTEEQLAQANEYYHKSLMLPSAVTAQVYTSYELAGHNAASGFLNGFTQDDIKSATVKFTRDFLAQLKGPDGFDINSPSKKTIPIGEGAAEGVEKGLKSPSVIESIKAYITNMANNITSKFRTAFSYDTFRLIGMQVPRGLAAGIKEGAKDVMDSLGTLSTNAVDKVKTVLKINSPSKVFAQLGSSIDEGLAKGIIDNVSMITRALDTTSTDTINTMRDTINKASAVLIDEVEDPVIRPVLDLSNIQNGSRLINGMIPNNRAVTATASIQTNLQNAQSLLAEPKTVKAMTDNDDVVDAINSLKGDILSLNDAIANIKLVMDTGKVVGAMAPAMDTQLYARQVMAGRGI